MGNRHRSSQRRGDQMARGNKTIESDRSDDHLARENALRKDSIAQTRSHTNKVRKRKGLPPLEVTDPDLKAPNDELQHQILDESGDSELITDAGLIVTLRAYVEGQGTAAEGDDIVAMHRRIRRERARFRELNGVMVEVGQKLKRSDQTRNDKIRRVPGILKTTMARLMPTEAQAVGAVGMTRKDLNTAIDAVVDKFQRETGCEVLTAMAHRMSVTDLHLHIQYTMVQRFTETAHMLGHRLKPWRELASAKARAALLAEGIPNPRPAQVGAKKKQLIADGTLAPPPQAEVEYRKVAGMRDMGDGAILGYSFRQKLNLVRAAQQGGEMELAQRVAQRNDEKWGRFTPIANKPDDRLEAKYLDLWLERQWRQAVTSKLPREAQEKLISDGVDAARKYATYGTSLVEATHIDRRAKELDVREKEIEARALKVETARKEVEEIAVKEIERLQVSVMESEIKSRALQESNVRLQADRDRLARRAEELEQSGRLVAVEKADIEAALGNTRKELSQIRDAATRVTSILKLDDSDPVHLIEIMSQEIAHIKEFIRRFILSLWEALHQGKSLRQLIAQSARSQKIDLPDPKTSPQEPGLS